MSTGSDSAGPAAGSDPTPSPGSKRSEEADLLDGLHLRGVIRRDAVTSLAEDRELVVVQHGELAALTVAGPFRLAPLEHAAVVRHQRGVERIMFRTSIVPAPFGIAFRDRRSLLRFLNERHAAFLEALDFLADHWEMRLHLGCTEGGSDARRSAVLSAYRELRRSARAAVPLRSQLGDRFGAGFLVARDRWLTFVDRVHAVGEANPELGLDLTGPWPPYDFVRILP